MQDIFSSVILLATYNVCVYSHTHTTCMHTLDTISIHVHPLSALLCVSVALTHDILCSYMTEQGQKRGVWEGGR